MKVLNWGMQRDYHHWLKQQGIKSEGPGPGEQINSFASFPCRTDPLDPRHGMPPNTEVANYQQPDQNGMDLLPDGLSITAHQAAEAIEALERLARMDRPFSLHLSFQTPHPPMLPTQKYYNMYHPDNMMIPESLLDDLQNSAYKNPFHENYRNVSMVARWMANYYGIITEIDEWIGRILAKVEELGLSQNTLVVFSSDHGEMLGKFKVQ
jgi:arylsulfatase A-like enzyme